MQSGDGGAASPTGMSERPSCFGRGRREQTKKKLKQRHFSWKFFWSERHFFSVFVLSEHILWRYSNLND